MLFKLIIIGIIISNGIVELTIALKSFLIIDSLLATRFCKDCHRFNAWYISFCTITQKPKWNSQVVLLTDNTKF